MRSISPIARARLATSVPKKPLFPGRTISGADPHARVITGVPQASDSMNVGPVDGEQQRPRRSEEGLLALVVALADVLDARRIEQRLHLALVELPVVRVHLRRDLQRDARGARRLDREDRPLLGRDATEEEE